ncbi:DinB family protein [Ktedonosporobacter rubrisoli]|uniref:DinB family protein n=1 Tax=Ktedonosporobacter rubrisoli TaxID=2509675 RepID=A0A4P6JYI8_KTERU|nr:DinB family protein [Ktedonosporobacter rubrisoli]QBD80605.1 DinB family protein [Ktedonosporobacter rubrisoli]
MMTTETSFEKVRRKLVAARIGFMGQLAKFNKKELTARPVEDGRSPLQVAHHLYITDGALLEQMRRVQDEDDPLIEPAEALASQRSEAAEPPVSLDSVLGGMAARREEIFEYLSKLPEDAWERSFRHPTLGECKFSQLVDDLAQHDQDHAQQLTEIKAASKS